MPLETRRSTDGQQIKPGARIRQHDTVLTRHAVQIVAVCDQVQPERWHGQVVAFGTAVMLTEQVGSEEAACRAAEKLLKDKLIGLLSD